MSTTSKIGWWIRNKFIEAGLLFVMIIGTMLVWLIYLLGSNRYREMVRRTFTRCEMFFLREKR